MGSFVYFALCLQPWRCLSGHLDCSRQDLEDWCGCRDSECLACLLTWSCAAQSQPFVSTGYAFPVLWRCIFENTGFFQYKIELFVLYCSSSTDYVTGRIRHEGQESLAQMTVPQSLFLAEGHWGTSPLSCRVQDGAGMFNFINWSLFLETRQMDINGEGMCNCGCSIRTALCSVFPDHFIDYEELILLLKI